MLELRNIVGGYGQSTVLRDVSLKVPDASVVALLGQGAGKSTTLRMASGLRPRAGAVLLDGQDVARLNPYQRTRRGVCHIFEGAACFRRSRPRES